MPRSTTILEITSNPTRLYRHQKTCEAQPRLGAFGSEIAYISHTGVLEVSRVRLERELMSKSITVFCLLFFSVAAFAQNDRGTITGTVLDPASAMVPNASVVASNASGVEFKTVSTGTGNYTIPSLPAGIYKLTVDAAGFKKFAQETFKFRSLRAS